MNYYRAGVGAMMFDQQLRRVEGLEKKAVADLHVLVDRANQTAGQVKAAIVAGAVVTALSTLLIMREARNARKGHP